MVRMISARPMQQSRASLELAILFKDRHRVTIPNIPLTALQIKG
jgi:hypothetical protein